MSLLSQWREYAYGLMTEHQKESNSGLIISG